MEKVFKTNIYGVEIMFTTDESDEDTQRAVDDVKALIAEKIEQASSVNVAKASIFALTCATRETRRSMKRKNSAKRCFASPKRSRTRRTTEKRLWRWLKDSVRKCLI